MDSPLDNEERVFPDDSEGEDSIDVDSDSDCSSDLVRQQQSRDSSMKKEFPTPEPEPDDTKTVADKRDSKKFLAVEEPVKKIAKKHATPFSVADILAKSPTKVDKETEEDLPKDCRLEGKVTGKNEQASIF